MLTHARASGVVGMQVWCMPVHASASSVSVVQSRCMRAHAGAPGVPVAAAARRGQVCVKKKQKKQNLSAVMRSWRMLGMPAHLAFADAVLVYACAYQCILRGGGVVLVMLRIPVRPVLKKKQIRENSNFLTFFKSAAFVFQVRAASGCGQALA